MLEPNAGHQRRAQMGELKSTLDARPLPAVVGRRAPEASVTYAFTHSGTPY